MDAESTNQALLTGTKPMPQICQEYESLLKIKRITEKEIADMFIKAYGRTVAAMHIYNYFTSKVSKAILAKF